MKKLEADEHHFFLLFLHPGSTSFSVARSLAWPLLLQQQLRLLQRLRLPEMQAKVREEPVKKDETKDAPGARADGRCLGLLARLLTWPLARLERVGVDPDLLKKKKLKNSKKVVVWLRATGDAPILKQQRYKVGSNERFSKVVDLLRERLKKESLVSCFFVFFPSFLFFSTSTSTSSSLSLSSFLFSFFSLSSLSSSTSKSLSLRASTSASAFSHWRTARRAARS
jgi:hypothetical protein